MFKRPTSRRRSQNEEIVLNLVPVLDAMVTLISFLLFTMSFISLVTIESPFPITSEKTNQEKLNEKPLQLTLTEKSDVVEIWSPFEKISTLTVQHLPDGTPDFQRIHEALITVKQKYPTESQIVFVPSSQSNYETLIQLMDASRELTPTDTPIYAKNEKTGIDEQVKKLFPQVIFGNLLGD